jgi:hypothetical protein
MKILALFGLVVAVAQTPNAPPLPFVDDGACPFECCTYRDWVAQGQFRAVKHWRPDGAGRRAPAFMIVKGERVTAMTGVVMTTQAGEVRVTRDSVIDVYSKRFPSARQQIKLAAGDRLFLLTSQGEGYMSGWHKGTLLESFDAAAIGPADACATRKDGCIGTLEKAPESEWWVKIRNRSGAIGWVLIPKGFAKPSFDRMDACG